MNAVLEAKLKTLPREPGVYMMKNARGEIIYVGKARTLRNRVSSYFVRPDGSVKTAALVAEIEDLDIILTKTELEALLLERTMIRDHQPKFNVLLRDDKEYPYVRVDLNDPWPVPEKTRRRKNDGAVYLGPFGSVGALRVLMDAAFRIFPMVRCTPEERQGRTRPCNYYQMKMCLGPCVYPVEHAEYVSMIQDVLAFLAGKNREVEAGIRAKMEAASARQAYELAAVFRDQLFAFKAVRERQSTVVQDVGDADILGVEHEEGLVAVAVVEVREGKMIGSESYLVQAPVQDTAGILEEFLLQYYETRLAPPELVVPISEREIEEMGELAAALRREETAAVTSLRTARQGSRKDLLDIARRNARHRLTEAVRTRAGHQAELEILRKFLGMDRLPRRMECIDVANLQGQATVASCVCFVDGKPAKHLYRQYNPETVEGQDDFGVIREVVRRRLVRGHEEKTLPDLLVIDGGAAQLGAANEGAAAAGVAGVVIVGLAKARLQDAGKMTAEAARHSDERVFLSGQAAPKVLAVGRPEYRLLTRLRDEAHRFANARHRRARRHEFFESELTDIHGIGEAMRKKLLEHFGGLEGLRRASLEQLRQVKGLREESAVLLHGRLHAED